MPNIAPARALEASLALVRDRPVGGNPHPSMREHRYVSASQLVKRTAKDLIAAILADKPADPKDAHWGEDGNAAAGTNLAFVRCQEPALHVVIPHSQDEGDGGFWTLNGHPDGLDLRSADGRAWGWHGHHGVAVEPMSWFATVFENKAPLFPPDLKQRELYYRQGLLYLAMLNVMHARGARSLGAAEWLSDDDPRKRAWALPEVLVPVQVVSCIQPKVAEKVEDAFPVDADACEKHLARYLEKAAVVVRGVRADDAEVGAAEWDTVKGKGLGEFSIKGAATIVTAEEVMRLTEARQAAAARRDAAAEEVDACTESLKNYFRHHGIAEAKVGEWRVQMRPVKGGIRHFVVDDSESLFVYGPKKKGGQGQPVEAVVAPVTA